MTKIKLKEFTEIATEQIENLRGLSLEDVLKVRSNFDKTKHAPGFSDLNDIALWFIKQFKEQEGRCCYCESHIADIKLLIEKEIIKPRRVKGDGVRGPRFEIERMDSVTNVYEPANCMLACYYCNNDKSNVYDAEDYKKYLAPAKKAYIEYLIKKL